MPPTVDAAAPSVSTLVAPVLVTFTGFVPNVPVAPAGSPVMDSVAAPVNPPKPVSVIVFVAVAPPAVTVVVAADVVIEKSGCTISVNGKLCTKDPLVALNDKLEVPPGVDEVVATVMAIAEFDAVTEVGLNVAVAPVGRPVMLKVVVELNPPAIVIAPV